MRGHLVRAFRVVVDETATAGRVERVMEKQRAVFLARIIGNEIGRLEDLRLALGQQRRPAGRKWNRVSPTGMTVRSKAVTSVCSSVRRSKLLATARNDAVATCPGLMKFRIRASSDGMTSRRPIS